MKSGQDFNASDDIRGDRLLLGYIAFQLKVP